MTPRRSTARPMLVRSALALLIGAAGTVGIAWGAVLIAEPGPGATLPLVDWPTIPGGLDLSEKQQRTLEHVPAIGSRGKYGALGDDVYVSLWAARGSGVRWNRWERTYPGPLDAEGMPRQTSLLKLVPQGGLKVRISRQLAALHAGWPWDTMSGHAKGRGVPGFKLQWGSDVIRLDASPEAMADRQGQLTAEKVLPLRPVFPGFYLSTLAIAAIVLAVAAALTTLRRAHRRRRGRCPACAYDTRGLTTCPECGLAARSANEPRP